MAKCVVVGCKNPLVGGVQAIIDVGHLQDGAPTISGQITCWCAEHDYVARKGIAGKKVRPLTQEELKRPS